MSLKLIDFFLYFIAIKSWEIYLERGVDNLCKWWNQRPRGGDAEPKHWMRSRNQGCGAETRDAEPKPGMRSRNQGCGAEARDVEPKRGIRRRNQGYGAETRVADPKSGIFREN